MSGYEQAQEYAAAAADSAGMSAQKLATYQESVEAKTNKAAAAFENFSMTLLDSNIIGGIMDLGTGLFNALSAFDAWPAKLALIIAALATLKGVFTTFKGTNIFANIANSFQGLGWPTMMGDKWNIVPSYSKEAA